MQTLNTVAASTSVKINVVCHSEGNYMLMLGMYAMGGSSGAYGQALMAACDINNGALLSASGTPNFGEGLAITQTWPQVTVYYSTDDVVLQQSNKQLTGRHNPNFQNRLGLDGPDDSGTLAASVALVDCSNVTVEANEDLYPQWPPETPDHTAYFYIPQVQQDWAQTLKGTPPSDVVNRVPGSTPQLFTMNLVNPPPQQIPPSSCPPRARELAFT